MPTSDRIYLLAFEYLNLHKHFGLFIPKSDDEADFKHEEVGGTGVLINVIDAPLSGYQLETKRDFDRNATPEVKKLHRLGMQPAAYSHL
jgi:hypothetical protein